MSNDRELRICDYLKKPELLPLKRLVRLTRDYHHMSGIVDNSNSPYSRWYYCLANECERRGLDLNRVIRSIK